MLVPVAGRAWSSVLRCVGEDPLDVSGDGFHISGVDCGGSGRGEWWAVRVVLEELWELGLDLLFRGELGWSLQDLDGLG